MQTTLNLLARDGAVYMAFSPHLTASHYAQLMALSEACVDADELRTGVAEWAAQQGLKFSLEEGEDPADPN